MIISTQGMSPEISSEVRDKFDINYQRALHPEPQRPKRRPSTSHETLPPYELAMKILTAAAKLQERIITGDHEKGASIIGFGRVGLEALQTLDDFEMQQTQVLNLTVPQSGHQITITSTSIPGVYYYTETGYEGAERYGIGVDNKYHALLITNPIEEFNPDYAEKHTVGPNFWVFPSTQAVQP